ncbi:ATP-dependent RNA helicase [Grosmannia clavigera kw1407]|uniref:RNA helicase n=1 Tax=Grosmannia clavigera (strain kw1407 / UAMH 11150) TaxID=655863 RepID=F0XQ69_GROCL|nr:ATP-dependent RNA helicase [Grosmannia clavigera kw1407]EFX00607.1 ATP-dependent RNA helicase [Grosmannia clavigera kw1407]
MWKAAVGSICPVCRSTVVLASQVRPALPQVWLSVQTRGLSVRPRRKTPSRMVLSDTVAQPPRPPQERGSRPRRGSDGPFGGMNRTVANVRAPLPQTESSSSKADSYRTKDRGGDKGKRSFKALRMQQSLATIGYGQRAHIKTRMQEVEEFEQFNLLPSIQTAVTSDALKGMIDVKPTPIQRLAIPALLGQTTDRRQSRQLAAGERRDFLLAAETGSGKTLAYLLPVIDALKRAEAADADIAAYQQRVAEEKAWRDDPQHRGAPSELEPHPTTARPRVVILVPSAELVSQVGAVAKALSHAVKFRTDLLSANVAPRIMERNLFSPAGIDVVVATPLLLATIAESDPNVLSRVTHLVVDEADSLLDRSFSPATTAIIDRARPSLRQLILCSATIPRRLDSLLAAQFPHMQRITTPNLHAIPRRVQLGVIDVSREPYRNNKNLACADAIWSIGKEAERHDVHGLADKDETDVRRIMVFVNERDKTQEVADYLRAKGIDAVALHRDAAESRHSDMLAAFTSTEPRKPRAATVEEPARVVAGRSLPNTKVIVATDLASRGIDTLAVRHVVLYDVPHTTIDFIHRLGRAGRMGRRGRGIVLVGKEDRRDIVAEVRESMYMGQALV